MSSPVFVIDDEIIASGKILSQDEIEKEIKKRMDEKKNLNLENLSKKGIISILIFTSLFLIGCEKNNSSENLTKEKENFTENQTKILKADKLEIVDFHGNRRCFSCQTIEKFTQETLNTFFQKEIQEGKIVFSSINVEDSKNKEIVEKYQARGSSLFINTISEGKDNISENTDVWRLVGDEKKFKDYLKNKIDNLLKN
jgi:PBP1b-binding outer membrane lipoprotein LpoB